MEKENILELYLTGIKNFLRKNSPVEAFEEVEAMEEYLAQCQIKFTSGSYKKPAACEDQSSRNIGHE